MRGGGGNWKNSGDVNVLTVYALDSRVPLALAPEGVL